MDGADSSLVERCEQPPHDFELQLGPECQRLLRLGPRPGDEVGPVAWVVPRQAFGSCSRPAVTLAAVSHMLAVLCVGAVVLAVQVLPERTAVLRIDTPVVAGNLYISFM